MEKILMVTLALVAIVYGHGESEIKVSREHQGEYKFGIDHHFHGHWKGDSHPHGFAGLGDGHGDYKGADVKFVHFLPQSLYGGHGGKEGKEGKEGGEEKEKEVQGGSGGSEGKEGGEEKDKHFGHGTSYINFNMKSIVEKHHGKEVEEVKEEKEEKVKEVQGGSGGSEGGEKKEGGEEKEGGKHFGHGTSHINFNMKSIVEEHHGKW
ncbi:oleosin GRP-17-like isoform X2 [Cimex lectularius]|uniref:CPR type cuticle protein n=1 Tax=Cimex lectularius TaxID=79782 RepID=A0A8I6R776_CIMLE|nr:oleosin GRP-17-like isoform X1 [Cimex lectularius]XP_014240048.1 oleosin GRP-17-like isoform X2 [Cimex lectularius]